MDLDKSICNLPIIGKIFTRLYNYFRKHILFTDLIHITFGLGLGLLIANKFIIGGIILLIIGILGHIYAYIKG
ncbi:hypothetical protein J4216_06525 [Candidatus Woesearchaeota archaeon]|nr:hypothetical protein [Candidatus Woesearchaeota archaeon]